MSKLEAAERQLDAAIRLFFAREDAVSVHTLAAAAYQVIIDICKQRGIERELEDSKILDELGIKREFLAEIRRPQNFFKHADKDAEQSVKLKPMQTALMMMSSVQYLYKLRQSHSSECNVFRIWFALLRPDCLPPAIRETLGLERISIPVTDYEFFTDAIAEQKRVSSQADPADPADA